MSTISQKLETAKILELKVELEKTPYPKLKKKLAEIGVPDAWVSGEEKDVIIRTAMQLLEKIGTEPVQKETEPVVEKEEVKTEVSTEPILDNVEVEKEDLKGESEIENIVSPDDPIEVEETDEDESPEQEFPKVQEVEKEVVKEKVFKEDDPRKFITPFTDMPIEDLHKNLERIGMLIKEAPDFHKVILIAKQKQITDRLIELGE